MEQFLTTAEKQANISVDFIDSFTAQNEAQILANNLQNSQFVKNETAPNLNFMGKVNLLLKKEVIKNSGVKWLHVAIALGAFVGYIEFIADTRTKRKYKIW